MRMTGEVEIVPGVIGPLEVLFGEGTEGMVTGHGQELSFVLRFDRATGRYVCQELTVRTGENGVPVTGESLRAVDVEMWITARLLGTNRDDVFRVLPNPDGAEPWGKMPPADISAEGPTDRVLQWVAHVYRLALAMNHRPTKGVEEMFGIPRATAGRWVAMARKRGHLGPAAVGKAGEAAPA